MRIQLTAEKSRESERPRREDILLDQPQMVTPVLPVYAAGVYTRGVANQEAWMHCVPSFKVQRLYPESLTPKPSVLLCGETSHAKREGLAGHAREGCSMLTSYEAQRTPHNIYCSATATPCQHHDGTLPRTARLLTVRLPSQAGHPLPTQA
jgi:hypothetical protein